MSPSSVIAIGSSASAFDGDGGRVASTSADHTVILWDEMAWELDVERLVQDICGIYMRNLTEREWDEFIPDQHYRQTCPESATD